MSVLSRRGFLTGAACLATGMATIRSSSPATYSAALAAPAELGAEEKIMAHFVAAERQTALPCFGGNSLPMWTFSDDGWLPVIRLNLGDRLDTVLDNRLPREGEHTSIHWHGIRLPNDQDGVPYLVQQPVLPGESHRYSFVPPDTGTFWFHTHCNTAEQLGRGLVGLLIVDGDAIVPYAADETVLLRDWRIDPDDGTFRKFVTTRGANRAGSYGNVRSANGATKADIRLPSSADCRLRVVNADPTRVMELALDGAEAAVIAIDGVAVPPFQLRT